MADKMTMAQVKETAKRNALNLLRPVFDSNDFVCYGSDFDNCVQFVIDGQPVWVTVTLTAKQYTRTKVSNPFDPFEAKETYDLEKKIKDKVKAEKAMAKAAKIAKSIKSTK